MNDATPDRQAVPAEPPTARTRKSLPRRAVDLIVAVVLAFLAVTAAAVAASLFLAFIRLFFEAIVAGLRALAG